MTNGCYFGDGTFSQRGINGYSASDKASSNGDSSRLRNHYITVLDAGCFCTCQHPVLAELDALRAPISGCLKGMAFVGLVLQLLLLSLEAALFVLVLYLVLLSVAALAQRSQHQSIPATPTTRFALLVPAHNEESVLGALFESVRAQTYPAALASM